MNSLHWVLSRPRHMLSRTGRSCALMCDEHPTMRARRCCTHASEGTVCRICLRRLRADAKVGDEDGAVAGAGAEDEAALR